MSIPTTGTAEVGAETFISQIVNESLDPDYAVHSAQHRDDPILHKRLSVGIRGVSLLLVGALVSITFSVAIAENRRRAPNVSEARASLIGQINTAIAAADTLNASVKQSRSNVDQLQQDSLKLTGEGVLTAKELNSLAALTGELKVRGNGVLLTVSAAKPANPVFDSDLQTLVNLLWANGAEAISVGGQRLSSTSAIRSAGAAILVDYRPIAPPYRIYAIGPQPALRTAIAHGAGKAFVKELANGYGILVKMQMRNKITLPSAQTFTLRAASKVLP